MSILTTLSQTFTLLGTLLQTEYDHTQLISILTKDDYLSHTQKLFFKAIDNGEDELIISLCIYLTALVDTNSFTKTDSYLAPIDSKIYIDYSKTKSLKNSFLTTLLDNSNYQFFLPKCVSLLQYQKSDKVIVAACHFFYRLCNMNNRLQEIMTNSPKWKLQEKIRPVLRNYKTEVKIAAISAIWALSTGQSPKRKRRIAAKFGIREINRMLISSSMNKKDEGESSENLQKLQMLGLTILRAYCYKWPSGQVICSSTETLINLRQLLIVIMIPGKSLPPLQILLLKTIRDLISIDGCYLVNSKVKESIINIGIPAYLTAIYENYSEEFSRIDKEITLLMVRILNFVNEANDPKPKVEAILNESLLMCLSLKEFKTVISLAHFSIPRTNMIQLSWRFDIRPCFEEHEAKKDYRKLADIISFVIFCSPRIDDVDGTQSVAYACRKLYDMLSSNDFKATKYSTKIITTLPMIGVNYLNALAKNNFVGYLLETLQTIEQKFPDLNQMQFTELEQLLASAITTFTVDGCGRRMVLGELRKNPDLITRILDIVTPDHTFWEEVIESLGQEDTLPEHKNLAVPELCTNMDSDFMVNLKFLKDRAGSFDIAEKKFSRMNLRTGSSGSTMRLSKNRTDLGDYQSYRKQKDKEYKRAKTAAPVGEIVTASSPRQYVPKNFKSSKAAQRILPKINISKDSAPERSKTALSGMRRHR